MVTNQVSPLGTPDFSQYLTNIANSGADVHHQRELGPRRRAVGPAGQAVRPHAEDEDGDPVPDPVPRQGSRARSSPRASTPPPTSGGRWKTSIRWPRCSSRRSTRSTATSRSGAPRTPTCSSRIWARMVSEAGSFYPPDVIKQYEKGETIPLDRRRCAFPRGRPPARPPGRHRQGQGAQGHEEQGGLLGGRRSRAGRAADAEAGRVRLQARRLHLSTLDAPAHARAARSVAAAAAVLRLPRSISC